MLKILWITNTQCGAAKKEYGKGNIGGGWLTSLEHELKQNNDIELHIAYLSSKYPNDSFVLEQVTYHPMYLSTSPKDKLYRVIGKQNKILSQKDSIILKQIETIINIVNPDVIHIHGSENCFGLIQEKTNIPVVISIQGLINPYYIKYYSGIPKSLADRKESYLKQLKKETFYDNYKYFRFCAERESRILNKAQYIIGRTTWDKNITKLFNPHSTYFQGEELLREEFYKHTWKENVSPHIFTITTILSDSLYKGYETLLLAAEQLSKSRFSFLWNVIGVTSNSPTIKIIEKALKRTSSQFNIQLLGKKQADEMMSYLLDSDVYCQVSHIENSPNSLCEAMLLGMPCIASNAGGTSSLLKDGDTGILIQDGDPFNLAGAILTSSTHLEELISYGKKAREVALLRHNREKARLQYYNIYKTIIQQHNEKHSI